MDRLDARSQPVSSIQVSETFLRHAAMLMRQRDAFDGEQTAEANKVWNEIMHEVRGRIVLGLDQLGVEDYPPSLGPENKVVVDATLEWIRSLLRHGEL